MADSPPGGDLETGQGELGGLGALGGLGELSRSPTPHGGAQRRQQRLESGTEIDNANASEVLSAIDAKSDTSNDKLTKLLPKFVRRKLTEQVGPDNDCPSTRRVVSDREPSESISATRHDADAGASVRDGISAQGDNNTRSKEDDPADGSPSDQSPVAADLASPPLRVLIVDDSSSTR